MKTFMICVFVVGALAVDATKKASVNKQLKRGILSLDEGSNIHKGEQLEQQLVRYTQPGHQYSVSSGPVSTHTAQVFYQEAGALQGKDRHGAEPTVVYDTQLGQNLHHQVGQGYDLSFNYQGQQVGQESYGYGDHASAVSPFGVESNFLKTAAVGVARQAPVAVPHQAPVAVPHQVTVEAQQQVPVHVGHQVTVQVPQSVPVQAPQQVPVGIQRLSVEAQRQVPVEVSHQVPLVQSFQVPAQFHQSVEVTRSLELPAPTPQTVYVTKAQEVEQPIPVVVRVPSPLPDHVAHQEPLNVVSGYEASHGKQSFAGFEYDFYSNPANFAALQVHQNPATVEVHQRFDVGSQQYNFGALENAFRNIHNSVSSEHHVGQTAQVKTGESDNQSSGYNYDKPTKKFNF